jgi:hypothetical protein
MFRGFTDAMCNVFGRAMTLKRGALEVPFRGVLRGLRAEELVQSATQGTLLCVMPAAQLGGTVPKKFDAITANGRTFTVQSVRECYDGGELASYKAYVLG